MRKYIIIAAAAIVAMASCTKVSTDPTAAEKKIGYQVATYMPQTKANSSLNSELSSLGVAAANMAFKSSAFINADNGNGGHTFGAFYPSNPETISWNATSTEWEPSKDYYWPKSPNSNIDFFSWYCYEGADPTLTNADGTNATLAWTNRTVAYKSDILYADVAWHQTANSETYQLEGVSEGVPTLFHHALAQVKFQAKIKENCDKKADSKNDGYFTFWEVKLSNVKIADNSVHKNGTLSLTITDPLTTDASTASTGAWTEPSPKIWANASTPAYVATATDWFTTDYATGTSALTLNYNALNATTYMPDGFIAVRPQAVSDAMLLTFTMTITTKYGTAVNTATAIGTEVLSVTAFAKAGTAITANGIKLNAMPSAPANWEMNKKVIYNLIIDPSTSTILYDPAVVNWEDATETTQEIPDNS